MLFNANRRLLLVLSTSLSCSLLFIQSAAGQYTPEHPKVQEMVNKGLKFLERAGPSINPEYRDGGPMLVGYTAYKVTGDPDHPLVKQGLEIAVKMCANISNAHSEKIVYEASVAAVFLCTVDAAKYDREIREVLYWFGNIQKQNGGFGYLNRNTGDTSQVQYVMLALWTMKEVGIDIPPQIAEGTIRYLKATIDPSGGWGYQGKVSLGAPVKQDKVTKSLATAGLGAIIIAGDVLGFYGERDRNKKNKEDGIPEVFERVDLERRKRLNARVITMTRADTDREITAGVRYQANSKPNRSLWWYYWLYSEERYESFVEIVENRQQKSPPWYNQGVTQLMQIQGPDGEWGGQNSNPDYTSAQISTAFSILFLIRSTQKAIGKLNEAFAAGGMGLPTDVSTVRMIGTKIVSDQEASVEGLISMLEDDEAAGVEVGLIPKHLKLNKDPKKRKEQVTRLSRLLMGPEYNARRVAAKLLGRSEQIDVVPDLIFALTDKDPLVPMIAEESLRLLSRKLTSGELGRKPTNNEREKAVEFWKEWYLDLKPDYIFINQ
ncbi:MAG: hypothetical protein AAF483_02085 [Planctomycetota bacterium]